MRKKNEADKTPAVNKWLLANWKRAYVLEVKYGSNKEEAHQSAFLKKIAGDGDYYKIPDTSGTTRPCDCVGFPKGTADALTVTVRDDLHTCDLYCRNTGETLTFKI